MPLETKTSSRLRISLATLWVIFCAFCSFTGWTLSVLHLLNAAGYAVSLGLGLLAFALWKRKNQAVLFQAQDFSKLRRRFGRAFPLGFLIVGMLAILGGILHPPNNYDGLAYRTPRVLHWLAEGRWHWIHTEFHRLNTRGCAFEWVTAPLFALARTDRFEFLINAICFLLVPGRVFGIWTRLGVRPRVAWHWMWLLPSGYCYVTQAGSSANDIFGALLAMAAIEYALRARASGRIGEFVVGILAAGLMTSGKAFNLLLLLPWVVAAGPALWLLLRRPLISTLAIFVAASISLIPTAVLNYRYCGDWTGQKAENLVILGSHTPVFHVEVNCVLLALNNFAPPIFPFSNSWRQFTERVTPAALSTRLYQNFEPGGARFEIPEMQTEEIAGLGLGVSALLVITLVYRWRFRSRAGVARGSLAVRVRQAKWLVPISAWAALCVFMAQSGLGCPGRYLSPFYALLVAPILAGDGAWLQLLRRVWWQRAAALVFILAGLLIVAMPARALFPAVTLLKALGAENSSQPLIKRAWTVYSIHGERAEAFAPAIALLPPGVTRLGFVTSDHPEASLWRPFGSRRVEHVCKFDGPEYLRERNIKYVLVNSFVVTNLYEMTMDEWLKKYNAEIIQSVSIPLRARWDTGQWDLVKVR